MLRIDSFIHRSSLSEVISRWMVGKPAPGDVMRLKTIVNFNSYIARLWIDWFARDLLEAFHGVSPIHYPISTKGQLKDFAIAHPRYTTARIEAMRLQYGRFPEDFYRDTPIDGVIYAAQFGDRQEFVGSSRIKRYRRIAEKGSRRIIDFMLGRIRANADLLAEERARNLGIAKDQLITPPETMVEEFNHAERRILKSIKNGMTQSDPLELEIPDVAGIKIIVEPKEYIRFREILARIPSLGIAEEERHTGKYDAINLRLTYGLPKERLLAEPLNEAYLRVLTYRGFHDSEVGRQYREFIESGEDEVGFEMIVASFEEFLESEIGHSMHEERIQEQRAHHEYNGHLATNIRFLMDFMLSLCSSPWCTDLEDVPIKLWIKYMPDTLERVVRKLYVPEKYFLDTVDTVSSAPAD
ncbi:MAG TPA: hypothetical protein VMG30_03635 [Acidobacteriota bacterium]|nr:hypothetical protein [Acidobacteriota bacterium]